MRTYKITGTVNGMKSESIMISAEDKPTAIVKFFDQVMGLGLAMHQFDNAIRKVKNEGNPVLSMIECDEVLE